MLSNRPARYISFLLAAFYLLISGCAHHQTLAPEKTHTVYKTENVTEGAAARFAPMFLTYEHRNIYNRIGSPSAVYNRNNKEHIYIDTDVPAVYYMSEDFLTGKDKYTNHIYRVHFPGIPFSLVPFNLTAGKNIGLIVVVTVNSEDQPILITTVHTCGCYLAIIPTSHLPADSYPENWKEETMKVYGERLPWQLNYNDLKAPQLLVHLRPDVHRVMDLEIIERNEIYTGNGFRTIDMQLSNMDKLENISINNQTTSLYYEEGPLKGHVKGSVKLWETLFLSLISLDLFVGTDKDFLNTDATGNTFYTSLKPWNRYSSDMSNFREFLEFWGWRL